MQALADDPEALSTVARVQVVDQGTDPLESRERFAEVSAALGAQLRYVRQPNLGGAGRLHPRPVRLHRAGRPRATTTSC